MIKEQWLKALSRLRHGTLLFVGPDGEEVACGGNLPGPHARFVVHDWAVLRRAAARGDIGLGEDYVAEAWETDNIEAVISVFLLNFDLIDDYANGNLVNRILFALLNGFVRANSLRGSRRNIEAHYDVGNAFYRLWLDETMTYSSALFAEPSASLGDAQRAKHGRILSKLEAGRVLEIGCGWGGFAELAARAGHDVTGITISRAQHAYAAARLGGKADIRLQDYRKVTEQFDAVVSIEMFEAVGERYWPRFFEALARRLKEGGKAIVQTILIRDEIFAEYRRRSDYIRHYVFPGGMLPSLGRFREEAARAGFRMADVFRFGQDYARTLREWSARLRDCESAVIGLGHDKSFVRGWQFYLGMCAAAFAVGRTDVAQIELVRL